METSDALRTRMDDLNKRTGNLLGTKTEELASLIHEYALCYGNLEMERRLTGMTSDLETEIKMRGVLEFRDYVKELGSKPVEPPAPKKRRPRFLGI